MKKIAVLLASLVFVIHMAGCTSSDSKDDTTNSDQAVSDDLGTADTATDQAVTDQTTPPPADGQTVTADNNGSSDQGFLDDQQLPADAAGNTNATPDNGATASTDAAATPPPDVAATSEPTSDDAAATTTDTASAAAPADNAIPDLNSPSTAETPAAAPDMTSPLAATTAEAPAEPKPVAHLKKVEEQPIHRAGLLLNAVYIARKDDSYKSISQMIYGSPAKVAELKKANPAYKKPHPGDKIYYNSPVRPTDEAKVLTYYEDNGMVPETYVAKEGDDLKKVSKELLGYDNAWKEVWATNASLESKGKLPAGTELRYWKGPAVAAAPAMGEVAQANPTPPPDMQTPPPQANNPPPPDLPPPPPNPQMQTPPPPQPEQNQAMNQANNPPPPDLPPPPPPPAEAVNPPPPPAPPVAKKTIKPDQPEGMDQDLMMSLAGAGIIAAGLAALVIVRKRRQQKAMASGFNDTQVGT